MERTIIHVDLNNFYASVECFLNPALRPYPVVVGGDEDSRHGIVLAKNQLAKKYGIQTGETLWQARQKCPGLKSVRPNFENYLKFSRLARDIYARYTDQMESFGIDENWLDVTGSVNLFGDGPHIADEIRELVKREMGVTVSAGVSFNKVFAKLGSDMKKPDATTVITRENFREKIWPLPASDLLYVGRSTTKRLARFGIYTIGDLAKTPIESLNRTLGVWGASLSRYANGQDSSRVSNNGEAGIIKSVGNSSTLCRDISELADVKKVFYMLAESVAARLREHRLKATTVQIYVRDKDLESCERQAQLAYPSYTAGEIAEKALEIFIKKYTITKPIRSLGVRGCNVIPDDSVEQLDIYSDYKKRAREERLEFAIDELRARFGYKTIQRGIVFEDARLTHMNTGEHMIHPVAFVGTARSV